MSADRSAEPNSPSFVPVGKRILFTDEDLVQWLITRREDAQ